ncbi:murein biosynthesis integral membrane protein MurJ [Desulfofundulus thermosubterraneus]|uniref:Probable lipid II flippase MurJ n=1 Tax=Desulfofundulus thermosubterraneus DSM 16057 TaxID=1121432 RepID=A0A1M6LBN2_9FIRM|nr:murein biosynthesis integral membrane protein MurJ [Desulfofundulus thermosubterraneus]SHJ68621.1 putative peptidoglycan lipid II flippase [Desulfofundulus thermosubterraneus DSM 16057]
MSRSNNIARATAVIAVFTLLSKILGFVREMALAYVFGASAATDAYLVAYTVPNVIFAVLGGALTVTAVPLFASYATAGKRDEAWRLFAVFSTLLSAVLLAVVLAGVPLARQIVWLVAPGLPEGTARLAAVLLAVMLPGVLFLSLANLFYGLLNANHIFGPPALGPVVTNVFIIASILAGLRFGIAAVAVGTLLGNIAAMVLQLPYLRRAGFPFRPALEFHHPGLKQAFGLMFPVMIGTGIGQVYLIIDRVLASGLPEGSISALNYASKLILLPQGVIVMALGTAIFPALSNKAASGDDTGFSLTLLRAVKTVLLVALPAGVGLAALREPVVRLLFARGAFDERDAAMTVFALLCFSFGLAGQCLGPVLTRGFYALQDTATPVKVGVCTVGLNLVFSLLLIRPLAHGGLALANSLAATFNVVVLFYLLARKVPGFGVKKALFFAAGTAVASLLAGGAAAFVDGYLAGVLAGGTAVLALRLVMDALAGLLVFAGVCRFLRLDEYLYLEGILRRAFQRGMSFIRARPLYRSR